MADNQNNLNKAEETINKLQQQRLAFGREEIDQKRELLGAFKSIENVLMKQFGVMDNIHANLKSTRDLNREILKSKNRISEISVKEAQLSKTVAAGLANQIKQEQELLRQQGEKSDIYVKQLNTLQHQEEQLRSLRDDDNKNLNRLKALQRKSATAERAAEIAALTTQRNNLTSQITNLSTQQVNIGKRIKDNLIEEEKLNRNIQTLISSDVDGNARRLVGYQQLSEALRDQLDSLRSSAIVSQKLDNSLWQITNNIIERFPALGGVTTMFREAAEASREAGSGLRGFIAGTSKFLESSVSTYALIAAAIVSAGKADAQVTNIAKSLGISKDLASDIREDFVKYSKLTSDTFITTTKLLEAQENLTKELGVAVTFSGKQLEDHVRLTKLLGLAENEAASIAKFGLITKKTTEDTTKAIFKGSIAAQQQYNIALDNREVLRDISNISAGIGVKFKGNVELLGQAVVQAKALGVTLEQVDAIGESLLNFEGSLEAVLKAELLTGRQINVERARSAALLGDQRSLMTEIASQVGTLNEFNSLNVLAQKGLAEAFGLSRDEMAKMLLEQEKFNALGDVSKKTLQEQYELAKQKGIPIESQLMMSLQQQSAQEKFNNAISKLSDLLGNLIAGPFGEMLDGLANMLNNAMLIKGIFISLSAIISTKLVLGMAKFAIQTTAALGKAMGLAAATTTAAEASTLGGATPFILGGLAAVMGGLAAYMSMKDGIIGPDNKVLYNGDKGAIKFDKDDTIVAGTNLFDGGSKKETKPQFSDEKLDRIITQLERLNRKDTNVYLSESKLAAATATPIGTNMQKNATTLA